MGGIQIRKGKLNCARARRSGMNENTPDLLLCLGLSRGANAFVNNLCVYFSLDLLDVLERSACWRTHTTHSRNKTWGQHSFPSASRTTPHHHDNPLVLFLLMPGHGCAGRACLCLLEPPHLPTPHADSRLCLLPLRFFSPPPRRHCEAGHIIRPSTYETRYRSTEERPDGSRGDACMAPPNESSFHSDEHSSLPSQINLPHLHLHPHPYPHIKANTMGNKPATSRTTDPPPPTGSTPPQKVITMSASAGSTVLPSPSPPKPARRPSGSPSSSSSAAASSNSAVAMTAAAMGQKKEDEATTTTKSVKPSSSSAATAAATAGARRRPPPPPPSSSSSSSSSQQQQQQQPRQRQEEGGAPLLPRGLGPWTMPSPMTSQLEFWDK